MPGDDKKVNYEINVGADTRGADEASEAFDKVGKEAGDASKKIDDVKKGAGSQTSINIDGAKATAEARDVHNAVQAANQAADDHASINIDGSKAQSEARNTKDAVEDAKKAADKAPSKQGFFARLKGQFDELLSRFPLLQRGFEGMELAAKGPILAIVAAVTALTFAYRGLVSGVKAYIDESRNVGKVDGALAQSGQLTKAYRKEVLGLAREMADLTGVAESEWLNVLTKLIAFGSRGDTLGVDAETVENLAGLFGGREGLTQATEAYSKALQGEFGAFQELGFQLDLSASKHENITKVQRLARRGAGQLRAEARSAAGEMEDLGTQATRTAEGIGRLFANTGALSGGLSLLKSGFSAINEFLPQTTKQLEGLQNRLPDLAAGFKETSNSAKELSDEALKRVGEEAQIADNKIRDLIARLREQEQQALAITNARAANDLAQVDLNEESGDLTKEEANERRFQIREEAEGESLRIQLEANNAELVKIREAIEAADQRAADELQSGQEKSATINSEIAERQELLDRRDAIEAEQAAVRNERDSLRAELAKLRETPKALLGAPFSAIGLQEARIQNSGIRPRIEALNERDAELDKAVSAIGPEGERATAEIQELNSELQAIRDAFVETVEIAEGLKKELSFRQESLERRNQTLESVSGIERETRSTTREAARVREANEAKEAEKLERENAARKESALRVQEQSQLGSNIESFASRRLPEGELSSSIRERARSLNDGGDAREFAELESSLLEAFRAFETRDARLARQIQQIGQKVRLVASQVENNR